MVLLVMWPDGKEASPRRRSDSSERRTTGFLKNDMNSCRPFSNRTMRTDATCFGRLRLIADFNVFVTGSAITIAISKQKMEARARNPPKMSATKTIITSNGFQTSASLTAAMNKSSAGLVHRALIRCKSVWSIKKIQTGFTVLRGEQDRQEIWQD